MKLHQLLHEKCPTCGARIVAERQRSQHTNGQWFEEQEFECGCIVKHVPNYSREEVRTPCPNSASERQKEAKRIEALRKLRRYINRLDVDDDYKERLTRYWPR